MGDTDTEPENAESPEKVSSPEEVIENEIQELRDNSETDEALLDILAEHILKTEPTDRATEDAAAAIERLAQERAEGVSHDRSDHD